MALTRRVEIIEAEHRDVEYANREILAIDAPLAMSEELPEQPALTTTEELLNVIAQLKPLQKRCEQNAEQLVRDRFAQGVILQNVINTPARYGKGAVLDIARQVGCSDKLLYEAHTFARLLNYNTFELDAWINKQKELDRKPTMFLARENLIRPLKNPDAVGGKENHREMLLAEAEKAAANLAAAIAQDPDDPEVRGASEGIAEAIGDFLEWDDNSVSKEIERVELPSYKAWLHLTPDEGGGEICAITGEVGKRKIESNHLLIGDKSQSQKPSDFLMLPMTKRLHDEYHKIGHAEFEAKYHVNLLAKLMGVHLRYMLYIERHK